MKALILGPALYAGLLFLGAEYGHGIAWLPLAYVLGLSVVLGLLSWAFDRIHVNLDRGRENVAPDGPVYDLDDVRRVTDYRDPRAPIRVPVGPRYRWVIPDSHEVGDRQYDWDDVEVRSEVEEADEDWNEIK